MFTEALRRIRELRKPIKTESAIDWYQNLAIENPGEFVDLAMRSFEGSGLTIGQIRVEAMEELARVTLMVDIEKNPGRYNFESSI